MVDRAEVALAPTITPRESSETLAANPSDLAGTTPNLRLDGLRSGDVSFPPSIILAQATPTTRGTQTPITLDPNNPARIAGPGTQVDIIPKIEHGTRTETNAIVLHMTGSSGTNGTLNDYRNSADGNGAHFLIARDGTIIQTASLDARCYHVGSVRPKGFDPSPTGGNVRNDAILNAKEEAILNNGKLTFSQQVRQLNGLQMQKRYGEDPLDSTTRYPTNGDSIGIEFASRATTDAKGKVTFEAPTQAQLDAGRRLVNFLTGHYGLDRADLYEHPDISYKSYTEAQGLADQLFPATR